ncbi:MAG TPA: ABC transporter substrate-binding protein, partial [Streptomyces sp.]
MSERERTEGATDSTRRQWLAQMGGLAAGAGLSALGGTAARPAWAQGQPKRGGVLKVATVDKPVNMDPGYAQLYSSLQVYQNVYNKLVYVDDKGQFVPGLARSWKADGDKAWVFDLVDNAVFHNGEAFTAKDVAFTFNRLLDARNKLPMRVFFSPVEGVEALGAHQVRLSLSRPFGPLFAMLAQATEIVNEKALAEKDPKLFPVGTGPYRFVEWVKDDHITLERWDRYFRPGKPHLDRIIFQAPADDTVRLTGLQTGRYNWIQTVPPQRIPELERQTREMKSSPGRPYFPFYLML